MLLEWIKCQNNQWCAFEFVDLSNVNAFGVYVIWHASPSQRNTVRVGQGNIRERLTAHRSDPQILSYRSHGPLLATWATTDSISAAGIERFLAEQLNPLVGHRYPNVSPIPVNMPG